MIIIDTALKKREAEGKPLRIGLVGAGYMARGIALQFFTATRGMRLVAVANRSIERAEACYSQAGVECERVSDAPGALEQAIAANRCVVTDDAMALCRADGIDAIIEATGEAEPGAQVALEAIQHGKHVILMNAEVDATIGPILKVYADARASSTRTRMATSPG